ncbi:MAG TPA: hypothetical protein PKD45_04125 [Flavobacteriales bacterium]|nr:hypothetical protein [Flavobacteriales bacterium]
MGRFLARTSVFLLVAGALYTIAIVALTQIKVSGTPLIYRTGDYYKWPGDDTWDTFHEFAPHKHYDAIILGSSHTNRGYDPEVFAKRGYSVFVLGSKAQTPMNSYPVIKYLLDSSNCPLLIYDIFDKMLINNGMESTVDLMTNQPSNRVALYMAYAQRDLRTMNLMALRLALPLDSPYFDYGHYRSLGFSVWLDTLKDRGGLPDTTDLEISPRQRNYLQACIELCRDKGIQIVFSSHYVRSNRKGGTYARTTRFMDLLCRTNQVPYLDFSDQPHIENNLWFHDYNHMNLTGARIFTENLVDSLEALGYLRHGNDRP